MNELERVTNEELEEALNESKSRLANSINECLKSAVEVALLAAIIIAFGVASLIPRFLAFAAAGLLFVLDVAQVVTCVWAARIWREE